MIFLDYLFNLPNSTSGADQILIDTLTAVPSFTTWLLFFVYFIVLLGGIGQQQLRRGVADYPLWSVIASLVTFMVALLLSVVAGFIRLDWLVVVTVMTIFSGAWLFLDRRVGEV